MTVSLSAMLHDWTACYGLTFVNVTDFNKGKLCFLWTESDFADRGFCIGTLVFLCVLLRSGLCLIFIHFSDPEQIGILDMGQRILQ